MADVTALAVKAKMEAVASLLDAAWAHDDLRALDHARAILKSSRRQLTELRAVMVERQAK